MSFVDDAMKQRVNVMITTITFNRNIGLYWRVDTTICKVHGDKKYEILDN